MTNKLPEETYKYGEVSLTSDHSYVELFETLDPVGVPKRGSTTPLVLVMKDGEGYVIHGPKIADEIVKRFKDAKG